VNYEQVVRKVLREDGVEESTMMKMPCLRFKGEFLAMMFDKEEALIIKVAPERVYELVAEGKGKEFNLTGKRFREWVMIPLDREEEYEALLYEGLAYARGKKQKQEKPDG